MTQALVLGGGISGLSLAHFLRRAGASCGVRVLEANADVGGWVKTAHKDQFLFEEGPRGFRPSRNGTEMLHLVEELGLQEEMLAVDPQASARYILRNGKVEKLPDSIPEFIKWPLAPQAFKAGLRDLVVPRATTKDESIYDFASRRLGPVLADRLLDPMASGIFGGNIRNLSIHACFPMMSKMEQEYGSLVRAAFTPFKKKSDEKLMDGSVKSDFIRKHEKSVSVSFRKGMHTLIDALATSIQDDALSSLDVSSHVSRIEGDGDNAFAVHVSNGMKDTTETIPASHIFSTLPANHLASAVEDTYPQLAEALHRIQFVPMAMVHVGFNSPQLRSDGFGYLVPTCENERVLGVVFDSNTFPSQNVVPGQTRMSVMCGGAHHPEVESMSNEEIEEIAMDAIRRHLGIKDKPDFIRSMVLSKCIPQYHVNFADTLEEIEKALPKGLQLGGNSFHGVGVADAVTRSRQLALDFASSK